MIIMSIKSIIKDHWKKEGIKFAEKPFKWFKTLRSVTCDICGRSEKESYEDQGFSSWSILPHISSIDGKAPEICPVCLPSVDSKLTVRSPRWIRCIKCGGKQKEKIYGIGFPGWSPLPGLVIQSKDREQPYFCPNCSLELAIKLGEKFIRATWTALTYPASSLLTSTKMTQNQANFEAVAQQHTGAPELLNPGVKNVDFGHPEQFYNNAAGGSYGVGYNGLSVTNSDGSTEIVGLYHRSFGGTGLSFDAKITLLFRSQVEAIAGYYLKWVIGDGVGAGNKHFGFYLDNLVMKGINANGTNEKQTTLWTYDPGSPVDVLKIIFYPGNKIEFYQNGVLKGTSTEYLPSGSFAALGYMLYASAYRVGGTCRNIIYSWVVKTKEYKES